MVAAGAEIGKARRRHCRQAEALLLVVERRRALSTLYERAIAAAPATPARAYLVSECRAWATPLGGASKLWPR